MWLNNVLAIVAEADSFIDCNDDYDEKHLRCVGM